MNNTILILNANLVNEGNITRTDIFIKDGIFQKIGNNLTGLHADTVIDQPELYVFPGIIDDQVHFRDWNQSHKATVASESRAAIIGGITSFIEQPNTDPQIITQELLEQRNQHNKQNSLCNFGVNFGATLTNYDEVMRLDLKNNPGVKIFWGSSTGGMLVNDPELVAKMGRNSGAIFIFHSEDEASIQKNNADKDHTQGFASWHPIIRNAEACMISTKQILQIAAETKMRTHLYHITTAIEVPLFDNTIPLAEKQITTEVCVHHLSFNANDYERYGNLLKCNPAIKSSEDQRALWEGLLDDRLDIVATDHAPHTLKEKEVGYFSAPSGVPLIQFSLNKMLEFYHKKWISLERIVEKMSHNPAICFKIEKRGFVREGYHADLTLVDVNNTTVVNKDSIVYKCKWSPFEGETFKSRVAYTIVGGIIKQKDGIIIDETPGSQMEYRVS